MSPESSPLTTGILIPFQISPHISPFHSVYWPLLFHKHAIILCFAIQVHFLERSVPIMLSADALTDASATAATQAPSSEQALPALKSKGKLRSWFSKIGRKVGRKSSDSTGTPATALAAPASTNLLGSLAKLGRKLTADKPSALSLPHELEEETAKVFAAIEEE